ncbi:cation diffusion facilitator family transporter [Hypnocyclicus thermotrophus]|uniref:Cation diffusion facilitator family transporter n=1 Tax=Hypnocyclicus thermotrophus TaxID=1627895 RepID=A0AA46I502_9FUSO|nr:cation diffusion facilitator family transporter [Hypnocyclicus thermotrophus]TDT68056.1 cation diffusion facilitator family transporter [Hypnocyclicus thermotrophus]
MNITDRSKEANRITIIGSIENLFLTIFKLFAGVIGNSSAMLADGIHSLSDFSTDFIVILSFIFSKKPEDKDHNYGHGKIETLSTAIISIILIYVGLMLMKTGSLKVYSILNGTNLSPPKSIAVWAAFLSIVIKEIMYRQTLYVAKKIDSSILKANAWHHRSDAFSSFGTFIGIGIAFLFGHKWIIFDPIASIIVSLFVIKVGLSILYTTVNELIEGALDEEETKKIENIISSCNEIINYHDLKTRRIGNSIAIEFHILVNRNYSFVKVHDITESIENNLKKAFSNQHLYISIHMEPSEK